MSDEHLDGLMDEMARRIATHLATELRPPEKPFLTPREVAQRLGLGERTVWTQIGRGDILKGMLASLPSPIRPERALLFPNSEGNLWAYTHWRRQILVPAREASGVDARAHELRHSWVSLLRAEGVPDVELARISGHSVLTMTGRYAHSVAPEQAFETIRRAVG